MAKVVIGFGAIALLLLVLGQYKPDLFKTGIAHLQPPARIALRKRPIRIKPMEPRSQDRSVDTVPVPVIPGQGIHTGPVALADLLEACDEYSYEAYFSPTAKSMAHEQLLLGEYARRTGDRPERRDQQINAMSALCELTWDRNAAARHAIERRLYGPEHAR